MPQRRLDEIEQACLELLNQYPDGVSEYTLLKRLRCSDYGLFPRLALGDTLGLFRCHFLLFHALYRLRDRLHAERRASLQISALLIELDEYRPGEEGVCSGDGLRDYYLDLTNLDETGEAEVEALLEHFWQRSLPCDTERVNEALGELELEAAEDFATVKRQYRRLAMRHHPDRGGEEARMHALNEALTLLRRHFNA